MRSGTVTIDVRGKPEKSWQVKNLLDAFEHAYNFVYEDHKFTVRKQVDDEGEETDTLVLEIDGILFTKHPFVSPDFVLEEEKDRIIIVGFKVNGVLVFESERDTGEAETWSSAMFGNRVIKVFGDDPFNEVEIPRLEATSQVASEFLDAVIQKETVATGYEKFYMDKFFGMKTSLEESVVERLL